MQKKESVLKNVALPHSLEAERSLIASVMISQDVMDDLDQVISSDDFYKPAHQTVYQAFEYLSKNKDVCDLVTVSNRLTEMGEFEAVGGTQFLQEIYDSAFTAANIMHYAKIIRDKAFVRRLIKLCQGTIEDAFGLESDVEDFIAKAESEIYALSDNRTTSWLKPAKDIVNVSMDRLQDLFSNKSDVTGIPTGFVELDKITTGLQSKDLIILAARPSMGKTALSLNMAINSAIRHKKKVAYFSLEMSKEQLMFRILSMESRIRLSDIRVGKIKNADWKVLVDTASRISPAPLFIDDTSDVGPNEILSKCRRLKNKHGLDLIVVDYLQLMDVKHKVESRERAVSEISKMLKKIAKELDVAILALSQLNRSVESRSSKRPMLSDLRESGSIEQDADVIMMIYREDYYEKENTSNSGVAEIIVSKQRNGPTGKISLAWVPEFGTFANLAPKSYVSGGVGPELRD